MKKYILILYDIDSFKINPDDINTNSNICKIAFFDPETNEKDFDVPVLTYKLDAMEFIRSNKLKKLLKHENHHGIVIEQDDLPAEGKEFFVRPIELQEKDFDPPKFTLTPRQRKVMDLLADGLQYKEIATEINRSFHTVKNHISNAYVRMEVNSCAEAVDKYLRYKKLMN